MDVSAPNPAPGFAKHPGYRLTIEPHPKRMRVVFNGQVIAESVRVLVMGESKHPPVHYFPLADVRREFLAPSEHHSYCPFKGEASYYTVTAGARTAENAVWFYPEPYAEVAGIKDTVAFYFDRMDQWFEDGVELIAPPAAPTN